MMRSLPWKIGPAAPRWVARHALLIAGVVFLASCEVHSVTGPAAVQMGGNATYTMLFTADSGAINGTAVVISDVPVGWGVFSATYNGTVNGAPASGNANVLLTDPGTPCTLSLPPVVPGYQRLFLTAGPFATVLSTDSATLTITFVVGGVPGNYILGFRGSYVGPGPFCGLENTIAVAASAQEIPATGDGGKLLLIVALLAAGTALLAKRAFV